MKQIVFSFAIALTIVGCKTDFEVNAPYDRIPIIYGILDQSVDTQFIKINRSFLGTDNLSYASINDSMYFQELEVKVEEINANGNIDNVYSLQSKFVPVNSNNGIFFTGNQKVYYFVPSVPLDQTKDYQIKGEGDGKPFSSKTNIIQAFDFAFKFKNSTSVNGVKLYSNGNYYDIKPTWNQSPDAESYDVVMRFHYTETKNGIETQKYIDWNMGSSKPTNFGDLSVELNTEGFYALLANNSDLKDTVGVSKRVIGNVDFRVTSANYILKTYMDVSSPNNSIAFDKPDYTNIEGGRGVWASRFTAELNDRALSEKSIEFLAEGSYTRDFKFCSDNPVYAANSFYCP